MQPIYIAILIAAIIGTILVGFLLYAGVEIVRAEREWMRLRLDRLKANRQLRLNRKPVRL